ncbi:MAG: tRNA uridine-5-carboxymethylaminomethyl(34) synthesis GTPase MnmE [Ignavibacteriae bacterium HGW-Ignavibacteriae-3]|nr:MAG: tRNA uridine-5-carboxymethylaminomethyl(34) synthesis GTPase MnmE [Ignavibacteriae bacterium HGW-Ignavibacteriae-3]
MTLSHNEDTIVALATPAGVGAISVIRVSGPQSFTSVDKIFQGKSKLADCHSHTIHYGKIYDPVSIVIDDVLVSVFKCPHSYTGEDSIEISTHGSSLITEKIISALVESGVRLAEPGEFTKRAFLNGRLDLTQAEAVADVINSRTEASLRGARNQLDGLLSQKVEWMREILINTSSLIELELDFAEEDVEFMSLDKVLENLDMIEGEIDALLGTYSFGRVIKDGVNVALVGETNVGKSSLLNYLLKEARAIVSEIPGTTRDIIREDLSIDGILFKLFDTAGMRTSEDVIEKEGILRSRDAVKSADIVLFMNDIVAGFSSDLYRELLELTSEERIIKVFNKFDLDRSDSPEADVKISAKTGEGINLLFAKLKEKAVGSQNYTEKTAIISSLRHYNAMNSAKEYLRNARTSIQNKLTGEFVALDLRNAETSLSEIIGKVTSDDILNNIFAKFCIGK